MNVDNATGIEWDIPNGLAPGASQTFSWNTVINDTVPAGGFSFAGASGTTVGGTVATITDPNTSATASAYSATINWGDGTTSAGNRQRRQRQLHGELATTPTPWRGRTRSR